MKPAKQIEPAYLRPFWALFEPLTKKLDVTQLWNDVLDLFIGQFLISESMQNGAVTIDNLPQEIAEPHIKRDYDRAALSLGRDPHIKEEVGKIIHELLRVIAIHNSQDKKLPNGTLVYITHCYASMYESGKEGRWLDVFGDISYLLMERFPRAVFQPCCADIAITKQWAKAQLSGMDLSTLSVNDRLTMQNQACGSGRTALAMQGLLPGAFNLINETTDPLHAKYTVLNLLLHGCYGQVTLLDKANKSNHLRTWDINRWLFHVLPPVQGLDLMPHVFDVTKNLSRSYRERHDGEGNYKVASEQKELTLKLEMMNRLGSGLGIGLNVKMVGDVLMIAPPERLGQLEAQLTGTNVAQLEPAIKPNGKAKSLTQRLFARQQAQQQRPAAASPAPPAPTPPAEPPPGAKPRTFERRRR